MIGDQNEALGGTGTGLLEQICVGGAGLRDPPDIGESGARNG